MNPYRIFTIVMFVTFFYLLGSAYAYTYGVNVYNLSVQNITISFYIKNTGDTGELVNYYVYVDNELIAQKSVGLSAGENKKIEKNYYFAPGKYRVKVVADTIGSTDFEETTYCYPGYTNNYRCYGNERQRENLYSDCSRDWINIEHCEFGCSNGICLKSEIECGVAIRSFEYQDEINVDQREFIITEIENTGNKRDTITVYLYLDGKLNSSYFVSLDSKESAEKIFSFYLEKGVHEILLQAVACGSMASMDSVQVKINVREISKAEPIISEPREAKPQEVNVSIRVYPTVLNASLYEGVATTLHINTTKAETFNITVSGIPAEWVNYPKQVEIKAEKNIYLYMTPQELGNYNLTVSVINGDRTLQSKIILSVIEKAKGYDFINFSNILLLLTIILILIVIFVGFKKLR